RTPLSSSFTLRRPPTPTLFPYTTLFRSVASRIVHADYRIMRTAVELCELNRVGDCTWSGKPQATEPQHVADQVTTVAVHARADLINGYFFRFWICCGARDACAACDGRNTAATFNVFNWLQVSNFDVLFNSAPNGLDYIGILGFALHPRLFRSNIRFRMPE